NLPRSFPVLSWFFQDAAIPIAAPSELAISRGVAAGANGNAGTRPSRGVHMNGRSFAAFTGWTLVVAVVTSGCGWQNPGGPTVAIETQHGPPAPVAGAK